MTHPARHLLLAASLVAVTFSASSAQAADPVTKAVKGKAVLLSPLAFIRVDDLQFGTAIVPRTGTGTVYLDPSDGTTTYSNLEAVASGVVQRGLFRGAGTIGETVTITGVLPDKLYLDGDTSAEAIDIAIEFDHAADATDGHWEYVIGTDHTYDILVGGTLTVLAGQTGGLYKNTMDITANYP